MKTIENVGFLGLGQMGAAMAERLLGKSYRLHVYDPVAAAMKPFVDSGAVAHISAFSVANVASVVFACLPSTQVSLKVAMGDGGVANGSAIRVYAEMSTIGTETVKKISDALKVRGIATVDAPITGGAIGARAGTLAMLVSGPPAAVESVRPLLECIGKEVYCLGDEPGMAQLMKIVNNLIGAATMTVFAEGLVMGAKAGLDADAMMEVLKVGTARSFIGCEVLGAAVGGRFSFGAALSILAKDVGLGMDEAARLGVRMPVINQARAVWQEAEDEGWGDEDFTVILKATEEKSGTLVRGRPI